MKVYKFGGASVKNAEAVRNVGRIIVNERENLVVVISAMGKTTNLLELLVKAYFEKSQDKWEIFQQFKNYHEEIITDLFAEKEIPTIVADLFTELQLKLKKQLLQQAMKTSLFLELK